MEQSPITIFAIVVMWVVFASAGISFIKAAIMEQAPKKSSKVGLVLREARFRARLVAGLLLLLWVAVSFVWMMIRWL